MIFFWSFVNSKKIFIVISDGNAIDEKCLRIVHNSRKTKNYFRNSCEALIQYKLKTEKKIYSVVVETCELCGRCEGHEDPTIW